MNAHTPGLWHFEESPLKTGWCVVTGNNYLADVHKHVGTSADDIQDEANARLIAAAPELFEALEELEALGSLEIPHRRNAALLKARAAIAKAKGETNE